MKKYVTFVLAMITAGVAHASTAPSPGIKVPEIDALAGLAAIAVVGSVMALVWERRRK